MLESWQDILSVIQGVAGVFGWGVFLAIAARFVFGAPKSIAFSWFWVGLAITAVTAFVVAFSDRRLDEPARGESTMLAMSHPYGGGLMDDIPRPEETLAGMLAIPIIVMIVGGGYLAFRTVMLNREMDVAEENPEH